MPISTLRGTSTHRQRWHALLALLLFPAPLLAQRERLTLRLEGFTQAPLTAPAGTVERDDFAPQALQLGLAHRIVRDRGRTIWLVGAQYRGVRAFLPQVTASSAPRNGENASMLHVATADLQLIKRVGTRHAVVAVLRPGLYGDGANVGDQLRVEGVVFVDRIRSAKSTIGAGLSYASSFGRILPVPVLHIVSRPSPKVVIDALLPSRADIWWTSRPGVELGVGEAQRIGSADQLQFANATIGPQLRYTPKGSKLQLTADLGVTMLRRLEYSRGTRTVADLEPGVAGLARIGMNWLF
jgi:hypothetical protein